MWPSGGGGGVRDLLASPLRTKYPREDTTTLAEERHTGVAESERHSFLEMAAEDYYLPPDGHELVKCNDVVPPAQPAKTRSRDGGLGPLKWKVNTTADINNNVSTFIKLFEPPF